jgi:glycosyltransferase involved in cell wall biosynthesis
LKKVAFVASYPPRQCGIATFTSDLIQAIQLNAPQVEIVVVAVENQPGYPNTPYPEEVKLVISQNKRTAYTQAARFINYSGAQLLCIQHEFGLFGGEAGEWLLNLVRQVDIPVVTVLHTVLREPEPAYCNVTLELARLSTRLVVMTNLSQQLLHQIYGTSLAKIAVIYHGVPDVPFASTASAKARLGLQGRTVLSTFGLINKDKGIEYVLQALPPIVKTHPEILYLVLGETHPLVREQDGERYRAELMEQVVALGLQSHVRFENRYLDFADLCHYLTATDIYLTPYLGREQVVSGTLAYALGFGKAIISTPYLYAQEALAGGRGILVSWRDSQAIRRAVTQLLDNPWQLLALSEAAYAYGHQMAWPLIGRQYLELFRTVVDLPQDKAVLGVGAHVMA